MRTFVVRGVVFLPCSVVVQATDEEQARKLAKRKTASVRNSSHGEWIIEDRPGKNPVEITDVVKAG